MSSDYKRSGPLVARERIEPPLEFGKFVLIERIGEGGMAQAFRATTSWAEGVAKEVCVKRILTPLAAEERMRAMFIQEARIAASLTHANIVPVYEFGVVGEYYFLAMEYVEGFTLREIMMQAARAGRWPELPVALHLISEVLEGLDYAHRKRDADGVELRIVHRDMTPGNVMASLAGEVKILDFGIAAMGGEDPSDGVTAAQSSGNAAARGKPGYMSPEQAVGMAVDRRSDIYSAGILLYELLTHRRLFKEKDVAARLKLSAKIEPASKLNRSVPSDLDALVAKALRPKPGDRYASAAAFRDALLDYMHDHGLRAGRAHVARALENLFEIEPGRPAPKPWEEDIRALGQGDALPRPPQQRSRRPTEGQISTTIGQVTLSSALRRAKRSRWRSRAFAAALTVLALAAAGAWYYYVRL